MTRTTGTSPVPPRHWLQLITNFGSPLDYDSRACHQESVTLVRDRLSELEARLARLEGAAGTLASTDLASGQTPVSSPDNNAPSPRHAQNKPTDFVDKVISQPPPGLCGVMAAYGDKT